MGTLSDRINRLPTQNRHLEDWSNTQTAWLAGFDTGLYEAEMLAKEADDLIEILYEAVWLTEIGKTKEMALDEAINAYQKYKEKNQ